MSLESALDTLFAAAEGPQSIGSSIRRFFFPERATAKTAMGENDKAQLMSDLLVCGSGLLVAGSCTVMMYKLGIFHKCLPSVIMNEVDSVATQIAQKTEPKKVPAGFQRTTGYMVRTYLKATVGFMGCVGGALCFFKLPHAPLALVTGGCLVSGGVLALMPRDNFNEGGRHLLAAAFCGTCGYALGPMGWIWYDSIGYLAAAIVSSTMGFAASALITRGRISYFFLSQSLSTAVALLATRAIALNDQSLTLQRMSDVNTLLGLQLFGNLAMAFFHSWRSMRFYEVGCNPEYYDTLVMNFFRFDDSLYDAFVIVAGTNYALFSVFRALCVYILRALIAKSDAKEKRRQEAEKRAGFGVSAANAAESTAKGHARSFVGTMDTADRVGHVFGTFVFFLAYLKFVGWLQKGNTTRKMEWIRKIFKSLNPLPMVG